MSFWKGEKVLVTGGSGFIGSWLISRLLGEGAEVTLLSRGTKGKKIPVLGDRITETSSVKADLTNKDEVNNAIASSEPSYCFHLAAQSDVSHSRSSPAETFEINLKGTWNLLEALRRQGENKGIIATSSVRAYPAKDTPCLETDALLGSTPYDVSKACVDTLARSYHGIYSMNTAVARVTNTYGGGDLNFSRIVPSAVKSTLSHENPSIKGNGEKLRDFMYVEDTVSGYMALMENISKQGVAGQAFNLATGKSVTLNNLVNEIIAQSGNRLEIEHNEGDNRGEVPTRILSAEKVSSLLGFKAKHSLEEGIEKTLEWYSKYLSK